MVYALSYEGIQKGGGVIFTHAKGRMPRINKVRRNSEDAYAFANGRNVPSPNQRFVTKAWTTSRGSLVIAGIPLTI